jgi:glycosyltransferase involved in cell wall biosynthesis
VEDQIRELRTKYPDEYDITVLCTDRFAHDSAADVYKWEGVRVVRLHARAKAWSAHFDEDVREFMDQWFRREKFDVVHVHALQGLTASVVQAAAEAGIPYVVSLHDAWWICGRQFLTSPTGRAIDPADWRDESDLLRGLPLPPGTERQLQALHRNARAQDEAARRGRREKLEYLREARRKMDAKFDKLVPDANLRLQMYSIYVRRQDLHDLLHHAAKRLAVSSSFAKLYENAGVEDVGVLGNSWQVYRPSPPRPDDTTLECAFIGGWSVHKGAGVLLEACRMIKAGNIKLTIVDHALPPGESHDVEWGAIAVRFVAPRPLAEMEDFYRSIDVLIAPSIWPESFGLVTREALTAGVWVIAAESGALAEPVQEGINGSVVPPRDAKALAEAIERAASPDGRAARRRWREDALEGRGLAQPPDNADALHRIYSEIAVR